VESCSFVVEHDDGRLEVLFWGTPFAKLVAMKDPKVADADEPVDAEVEIEAA
jgi:hypothetical protein